MNELNKVFAQRLKYIREEVKGITQAELGKLANISGTNICHLEKNGRVPAADTVRKLATVLQVSSDYLLGLTDMDENEIPKPKKIGLYIHIDDVKEVINSVNDIIQGGGSSHITKHMLYIMSKKKLHALEEE